MKKNTETAAAVTEPAAETSPADSAGEPQNAAKSEDTPDGSAEPTKESGEVSKGNAAAGPESGKDAGAAGRPERRRTSASSEGTRNGKTAGGPRRGRLKERTAKERAVKEKEEKALPEETAPDSAETAETAAEIPQEKASAEPAAAQETPAAAEVPEAAVRGHSWPHTLLYRDAPISVPPVSPSECCLHPFSYCLHSPVNLFHSATSSDFPVISAGCSIPISSIRVGMISASTPFSLSLYFGSAFTRMKGTGLVVWAV